MTYRLVTKSTVAETARIGNSVLVYVSKYSRAAGGIKEQRIYLIVRIGRCE